jgi:hypothetical protein
VPTAAWTTWQAAVDTSRTIVQAHSLDAISQQFSMRWIISHLIEEYARHNGHADLLRQELDGAVGE